MKYLILCLLFAAYSVPVGAAKMCECGNRNTAIVTYTVKSGGCCDGKTKGSGLHVTFTHEGGDLWSVASITSVSGSAAQSFCCLNL